MANFVSILILSWIFTGLSVSIDAASSTQSPNVLFIVVDDLRPTLGCYNDPIMKTKNIDNLASKSVLFEKAYVQQAICGPSRVSFLTSRRPDTTRLYDFYSYWRVHAGNYTTLPQHFKENGYITQSVGKVFHPGIACNRSDDSPYSWTNTPYHPSTQQYKMASVCPNADGSLSMNVVCPVDVNKMPEKSLPDIQSADFAIDFLNNMSTNETQPFFLAIGFHKPHLPLKYPKEYLDLYPLSEIHLAKYHTYPLRLPLVAWNPWTDIRMRDDVMRLNTSFPFGPVPEHYQLLMRQSYYAATSYMDTQVGRVLAALEKNKFSDNTIISFVGDHGWALGEHQEWSKYSLFNEAVRVPLLMYIPNVTHTRQPTEKVIFPFLNPFHQHHISNVPESSVSGLNLNLDENTYVDTHNSEEIVNKFSFSKDTYRPSKADTKETMHVNRHMNHDSKANSLLFEQKSSLDNSPFMSKDFNGKGFRTLAQVELVDLFPTLAQAAGLPLLPICPDDPFHTLLCTEGSSLMPLIHNVTGHNSASFDTASSGQIDNRDQADNEHEDIFKLAKECSPEFQPPKKVSFPWKKAVFSQYPRPSVEPREDSDKPHLKHIRIMGYSMWTSSFHYTEWVRFDPKTYRIHWKDVFGRELYLSDLDPYEVNNMAYFDKCAPLMAKLANSLHKGWRMAQPTLVPM